MTYRPDLIGINQFWDAAKTKYKEQIGSLNSRGKEFENLEVVEQLLKSFGSSDVRDIAGQGWERLLAAKPVV